MATAQEEPVPLPSAKPVALAANITLQPPLSRRGHGPGLVIFVPDTYSTENKGRDSKTLDPPPIQKWAEEGFAVVEVKTGGLDDSSRITAAWELSFKALTTLPECESDYKIGVVGKSRGLSICMDYVK